MNKAMNDISADLTCNQRELEKFLDETRAPLSDYEMIAMSAYFQSEIDSVTETAIF